MTPHQELIIGKAVDQLNVVRQMLDDVMYRTDGLSDSEFARVRAAYDKICSAIDNL